MYEDGRTMWSPQMVCSLWRHFLETSSLVKMTSRAYRVRLIIGGLKTTGEGVLDRGNPPAELTLIPEGWTNTVPVHHAGSSDRDGARNREKRYRGSRGAVRLERSTSRAGPPSGSQGRYGGCRRQGYLMMVSPSPRGESHSGAIALGLRP